MRDEDIWVNMNGHQIKMPKPSYEDSRERIFETRLSTEYGTTMEEFLEMLKEHYPERLI